MIFSILAGSTPAAPRGLIVSIQERATDLRLGFFASGGLFDLSGWFQSTPVTNQPAFNRGANATRLQIYPGNVETQVGSQTVFSAIAFDAADQAVSGVAVSWTQQKNAPNAPVRAMRGPSFAPFEPGTYTITASGNNGNLSASVTAVVAPPASTNPVDVTTTISSRETSSSANLTLNSLTGDPEGWNSNNYFVIDDPDNGTGNPPGAAVDDGAGNGNFQMSAPVLSLPGRGVDLALNLKYNSRVWNKENGKIVFDIDRGSPAPGWSLGFGKMVVAGETGGCFLIDADGTRHGYTGNLSVGPRTPGNQVDRRISFDGRTTDGTFIDYSCAADLHTPTNTYFYPGRGQAKLANGTVIDYTQLDIHSGHIYPTLITDPNGNYIAVTYENNGSGMRITTITDTSARIVRFRYDENNRLYEIKGPGLGGTERTLVKLHYKSLTLNYAFDSSLTPQVRNSPLWVLDAIYYPATNTGYWFGDADSYSSYGMLEKIVEKSGMIWSASNEAQGSITTVGQTTKQTIYQYLPPPSGGYGNAPTFDKQTVTWAGATDGAAVTDYFVDNAATFNDTVSDSPARLTQVTQPSGIVNKQYSYRTPGAWTDGLVFADQTFVPDPPIVPDPNNSTTPLKMISMSRASWQPGDYGSPRPQWTESWTESDKDAGLTVRSEMDYQSGKFNQLTKACKFNVIDGDKQLQQCAVSDFNNNSAYIGATETFPGATIPVHRNNHVFNLINWTETRNANGVPISRTESFYDEYATTTPGLIDAPDVVRHDHTFNPHTTQVYYVNGECLEVQEHPHGGQYCVNYEQIPESVFKSTTNYRGNLTTTKTYAVVTNTTLDGEITENREYDIAGNVVSVSTSAGEKTSFKYNDDDAATNDYDYAYPQSITSGAANASAAQKRNTTRQTFDFYTGMVLTATDANGLVSVSEYDAESLRVTKAITPTGAYTTYAYNDPARTITEKIFAADATRVGETIKYLDGLGNVIREESKEIGEVVDIVETKYNKSGQVVQTSRPYRIGDTIQWTTNTFDSQGRTIATIEPDGSTAQIKYNKAALGNSGTTRPDSASTAPGSAVLVTDAWGRERWSLTDEQNRLIEVVEPNPNPNLNPGGSVFASDSLATKYKYDLQNRLIEIEQGGQKRFFAYDSLGRLTRQKLAEQTATLDDTGAFVGATHSNAKWSEAFFYDSRSNLIQKTDARGVKANYSYSAASVLDPLNRLQEVSYDLSGPLEAGVTVHAAAKTSYEYETGGDKTRVKKITTENVSTEEFVYDSQSRLHRETFTYLDRPAQPLVTESWYDSLNRTTQMRYPAQYTLSGGEPRKLTDIELDAVGRLKTLKVDNVQFAGGVEYNSADQITSLKVGYGDHQMTEKYLFDVQTGLLANQQVKRANGEKLIDLSYDYSRNQSIGSGGGKTGHLTRIVNNLDRNKDKSYQFDALGRLTKAVGGINETWTQNYAYDRFGNRTNVTATGVEALRAPGGGEVGGGSGDTKEQSGSKNAASPSGSKMTGFETPIANQINPPTARQLTENVNRYLTESATNQQQTDTVSDSASGGKTNGEKSPDDNNSGGKSENEGEPSLNTTINRTPFDFDGDGKADPAMWNRTNALWTIKKSGNNQTATTTLGGTKTHIAPGDYDGDGKYDEAVWDTETGIWTIKYSSTGATVTQLWGQAGDVIVPADYDGDLKTDFAVWRPAIGDWSVLQSSNNQITGINWGNKIYGDIATPGDYDGDGRSDYAVWRPTAAGYWHLLVVHSAGGSTPSSFQWGSAGDVPVPADYDGDEKTDLAVWRPSNGQFYAYGTTVGYINIALGSQSERDVPVPADYDGDNKTDFAVWRPSTGVWYIRQSTTATVVTQTLGAAGELAVESAYIRRSSAPKRQNQDIETDGHAALSYNELTNRITTSGFEYDANGNQTKALAQNGTDKLRFEYDAANRLVKTKKDSDGTLIETFFYGASNQRIAALDHHYNQKTYYGGSVEYTEISGATKFLWSKVEIYFGEQLLSTVTKTSGGETTEFHHPDRLGTRLVTNAFDGTFYEQATLPFGSALSSESTGGTSRRFTSYERSNATGLDYAVNRHYDAKQGRFTQVDPIGISAVDVQNPQTLNLYAYCGNDPVNHTDPDGLFWGFFKKIFKSIAKHLKFIALAGAIAIAAITIIMMPGSAALWFKVLTVIGAVANAASNVMSYLGLNTAATILGLIGAGTSFGLGFYDKAGQLLKAWTTKAILNLVSKGATLASKTLASLGFKSASQILGLGSTVAGFISEGYKGDIQRPKFSFNYKAWNRSSWKWFKFLRNSSEQVATIAGANTVAAYLGLAGIAEDIYDFRGLFKKLPDSTLPNLVGHPTGIPDRLPDGKLNPLHVVWKTAAVVVRVQKGLSISNRAFNRIDRVVSVR